MGEFRFNDYVVYPCHGVGVVVGIEKQEIAGHKLELITIDFEADRMRVSIPIAKAQKNGLRLLCSSNTVDKALSVLSTKPKKSRAIWAKRALEYDQKINSGDPITIAEVVRDLYQKVNLPEQSYSERQIYEQALERLTSEIAAVRQQDKATTRQQIHSALK